MGHFKQLKVILAGMLMLSVLTACISPSTSPSYVQSGDFVSVNLGGIKRNLGGQLLKRSQISATIKDANNNVYPLRIDRIYRVYPDHTSFYGAQMSMPPDAADPSSLYPYDGAVYVSLVLSDANNTPLPLSPGPATIAVSSSKLIQTAMFGEGSYASIAVQILPGTRTPSYEETQQYSTYAPMKYLSIKPTAGTPSSPIYGGQFELRYTAAAIASGSFEPRLVPISHDPNINIIQTTKDNGDGTKSLLAYITNPNGFEALSAWSMGKSNVLDLNFAIVSDNSDTFTNWQTNFNLVAAASYFVDQNGDTITNVTPTLLLE
jgi:hypothetical protein